MDILETANVIKAFEQLGYKKQGNNLVKQKDSRLI